MTIEGAEPILYAMAFALGAIVGSFANVCIHRLPRDESIVTPPSKCPSCNRSIAFYDNVPIFAWLALRGRCRWCRAPISPRYPLVELAVALLFVAAVILFGPTAHAVRAALLSAAAVILIATDLESRVLPDEITIGVAVIGILFAGALDLTSGRGFTWQRSELVEALVGAGLGAGLLLAVRAGYQALRGVEGMGLGDVKMIGMIGALTGPAGVLLSLFFGSFSGAVIGIGLIVGRRLRWVYARRLLERGRARESATAGGGLLLDPAGLLAATGATWSELPGSAPLGEVPAAARPVSRPLLAFVRLARRRARLGRTTSARVMLEDDTYFRVLAARAEPVPGGGLLVLLGRADIPFGVFLAVGSLVAFVFGRTALNLLLGDLVFPMSRLLP